MEVFKSILVILFALMILAVMLPLMSEVVSLLTDWGEILRDLVFNRR